MLENTYASRIVTVYENQKVISTGLYSYVRHPMYLATLLIFLPMPFVLGSYIAIIPMLIHPAIIAKRIKHEEKILVKELSGYKEYQKKVKWRLIPYIW